MPTVPLCADTLIRLGRNELRRRVNNALDLLAGDIGRTDDEKARKLRIDIELVPSRERDGSLSSVWIDGAVSVRLPLQPFEDVQALMEPGSCHLVFREDAQHARQTTFADLGIDLDPAAGG